MVQLERLMLVGLGALELLWGLARSCGDSWGGEWGAGDVDWLADAWIATMKSKHQAESFSKDCSKMHETTKPILQNRTSSSDSSAEAPSR